MNASETEEFLLQAKVFWKSIDTSPLAVKVWSRNLADIPLEQCERALDAYARGVHAGEDYPPKPADLLRLITRATLHLPNEDEAWRMVKAEISRVGFGHSLFHDGVSYEIRPCIPIPEVALAVDALGWRHIINTAGDSGQEGFTRDAFIKSYIRSCNKTRERMLLFGPDGIDDWRMEQARGVRTIVLGPPQTLYDLGAPEAYAALVDGSGPNAPQLRQTLAPELPAWSGNLASPEKQQMVVNGIKMISEAMTGQAIPSSALRRRKKDQGS